MILTQNSKTGYWTEFKGGKYALRNTHDPKQCEGRLCDVHNRRGPQPWASWPLNWREDRGMMEVIDPESGIGHPSRAQRDYWRSTLDDRAAGAEMTHGCDGGCEGMYD